MKKVFELSPSLRIDLGKLYDVDDMNEIDRLLLEGIADWTTKTGKITIRQLSVLGRLYKKYLQDGEYVHHNWVIWQAS